MPSHKLPPLPPHRSRYFSLLSSLLLGLATLYLVYSSLLASPAAPSNPRNPLPHASGSPQFKLSHIVNHDRKTLNVSAQLRSAMQIRHHGLATAADEPSFRGHATSALTNPRPIAFSHKTIKRLKDRDPDSVEKVIEYANTWRQRNLPEFQATQLDWTSDDVLVPDLTDRDTVIMLAYMAANAYVDVPYTGDWTNVTEPWNDTIHLGWDEDGVRGHVFATDDEQVVVISIKGTSAAVFDSGGETVPKDKINDNLLFSCCCARISYYWSTVCDCYTGKSYTCNQDCLERELYALDKYYKATLEIYRSVVELYPNADIWVTGHSLGGGLASLLGRTYGLPVVTYEAPGEMLPTRRMHLPMPPGVPRWDEHIWHIGHTADPIFMGLCNGAGSSCWVAGYAMETRCHSGLECVYDVVSDKGWHVSMLNHRIHTVIDDVILSYNNTPVCQVPNMCFDCFNWKFVSDDDDSRPVPTETSLLPTVTSSAPTSSQAPTSSKTPVQTPPNNDDDDDEVCKSRTWYGRCIEYGPPDKA